MSSEASAPASTEAINGAGPTPGEMLRIAREAAGLSQEDIAGKLKLAARQISAIETGDWSALPERTFTRGFMRSYARLVGLEPNSLGLEQSPTPPVAAADFRQTLDTVGEVTFDPSGKSRGPARWLVPALLVVTLVAGIFYFQGDHLAAMLPSPWGGGTPPPSIKSAVAAQAERADAAKQAAALATSAPAATPSIESPASTNPAASPLLTANSSVSNAGDGASAAAQPASIPAQLSASNAAVISLPLAAADSARVGEKRIVLTFTGKSWTEVRSKGEVIFSETALPGTREFSGAPPLSFAIGSASNVKLSVDGKPYDISNVTRNDVARFRIE